MIWTLYMKIRLLIIGILLTVLLVEFGIVIRSGNQMVDRLVDDVVSSSDLLAKSINTIFTDINQTINYIDDEMSVHSSSDSDYFSHLKNAGVSREEILNIYIAYKNGDFQLYPEADLPDDFDATERIWFMSAWESDGIQWSRPYDDLATGSYVITASKYVKLQDQGGVLGIDLSLDKLSEMINTISDSRDGWISIIHQDLIIASTDLNLNNKKLSELEGISIAENIPYYGTFLQDEGLYVARRIADVDLIALMYVPYDDVYGNRRELLLVVGVFTLILLIVGIVGSHFITKHFTSPINHLKDALATSSLQDEMVMLNEVTNDEINILIKEYNHLASHINNQNKRIYSLAYEDELTGLINRYKFREETMIRFEKKLRTSLFYIDLDNFKYINDTYGHEIGDMVLQRVSDRLQSFRISTECIARISGDEFVLTIEECNGECCERISNQLLSSLSRPYYINHLALNLTISIGIATYPEQANSYDDLLANAEIAMYSAKESGKDGFVYFDQSLYHDFLDEIEMETLLLRAIATDKLYAHYQPLIHLESKEIVGFEALARWTDDEKGPIYPDTFIPIAERNMSIIPLGWHILDEALHFGKELYKKYGRYYEVNVNVSVIQLMDEKFVDGVLAKLQKYNYPAKFLNLEITESVTLESNEDSMIKLAFLRKKDINISLDDFGTGYSSLGHLTDLSLSHIKIDRQLMIKAKQSDEIFTLMEGIVGFAHKINNIVVAEGIEDQDMEDMVFAMNADYGQGYMYGRPMSEKDFMSLLEAEGVRPK